MQMWIIIISSAIIAAAAVLIFALRRIRRGRTHERAVIDPGQGLAERFSSVFSRQGVGDEFWAEMERALIEADVGVDVARRLMQCARGLPDAQSVRRAMSDEMLRILSDAKGQPASACARAFVPKVVLVAGVNGVGKTTTIAKLAHGHMEEGRRVMLVAADTFRAAAVEQLAAWGKRLGCPVVAQKTGSDAASVAFDGIESARAKGYDVVIIDTAGRLHTKQNLMDELSKVVRVCGKAMEGAPHEKLIVIDATVGSNGLAQAREFHEAIGITGAVVAKLDGTAKGGILFAVANELRIPVTHIGTGEGMDDLRPFDPASYVRSIMS
jgi:fused signal recognition particle receptor